MQNKLKYIAYILVAVFIIGYIFYTMNGCSSEDRRVAPKSTQETLMDLSKQDTTAVMNLAKQYLDLVRDRKYDEALDMIYVLDKQEGIIPLSEENRQKQKQAYMMFPVYDYEITRVIFWKETDCRLDYSISITQPADGSEPAKMGCALRPIRYGHDWFLTIANRDTEYKNSEIEQ